MMTFYNTIAIDQPVEKVFNFINTFENLPKWNYYISKVERITDSKVPRMYQQVRMHETEFFEVKASIRNELIAIETTPESENYFKRTTELKSDGHTTIIMDKLHLETHTPGFLETLLAKKVKKAFLENLTKLKELLETGMTTLQDGRNILLPQSVAA